MTFYFRPLSARVDASEDSKEEDQYQGIAKVVLEVMIGEGDQDKLTKATSFSLHLKEQNQDKSFWTVAAKEQLVLRLSSEGEKDKLLGSSPLNLKELLFNFVGSKRDLFTQQIRLQNFTLNYEYRYNKYLQLCGQSSLSQWTLEDPEKAKPSTSAFDKVEGSLQSKKFQRPKQQLSEVKEVQFYRGACKTKNLFSILDGISESVDSQFKLIEKPYK